MLLELENGKALVQKIVGPEIAPEDKAGQIVAMISSEAVDSDGDIIYQGKHEDGAGWLLDRFNKHPVMLWMHDHMRPSMGKASAYLGDFGDGRALFATANFDQEDPFAKQIESKIRRGVLSETSVGFMANKWEPIDPNEPYGGYNLYENELIEYSWVNRGANPDVESFIKSACVSCPDLSKQIKTFDNVELVEMKAEFDARLKEIEAHLKNILDSMAGQVDLAAGHVSEEAKAESLLALAKQIADTQALFRGGK